MELLLCILLWLGTALAYTCKPACETCSIVDATKSASCISSIEGIGIPRHHCTVASTIGASTVLVTETTVVTTFVTPTVTLLQTRTFSNTSIVTVTEEPTETDTSFSIEFTTITSTIPTLTVTNVPTTITATARGRKRAIAGRGYHLLDPDCSCFLTSTCTVTVTPDPGVTATEFATTTTTDYSTITFNSTVSTTVVATTSTATAIGNGTVTFLLTEILTGTDITTIGLTTVTIQSTVTAPVIQLSSPTAVFGDAVNGSPANYDDVWAPLSLPFPIEMYNVSSSDIYLSVNGFISLDQQPGTSFINSQLPVPEDVSGANRLPNTSILALWDDLYIYAGTQQGIYYQIDGTVPGSRAVSFEFYTSAYRRNAEFYHFLMRYEEARPNRMTFRYFQVSQGGVSATIGAQSRSQNLWVQWSLDQANAVSDGQTLVLDTIANTITPA